MISFAQPKQIVRYIDPKGQEPFTEWINGLRDDMDQERILGRVLRLAAGNYGDCEPVGAGVYELRMFFGPGYRVYFAEETGDIVILLCGGDKKSQKRDIKQAKAYWKEYLDHDKKIQDK